MNRVTKIISLVGLARDLVQFKGHDVATHIAEDSQYEIPCKSNGLDDLMNSVSLMSDDQLDSFEREIHDLYTAEED